MNRLIKIADKIPCLGCGGKAVKNDLIYYASEVKDGMAIVETGPWHGSATAYILIGLNGKQNKVYCYDLWKIDEVFKKRAQHHHGIQYRKGQNLLPIFMKNIKPFDNGNIIPIRENVLDIKWSGDPIGLVVDDISSGKLKFDHTMKEFSKGFVSGETIIFLMDHFFYESRKNPDKFPFYHYQKKIMELNDKVFTFIKRPEYGAGRGHRKSKCGIYRYEGGEIKYPEEE